MWRGGNEEMDEVFMDEVRRERERKREKREKKGERERKNKKS
jgi:hypothetical protein